MDGGAKTPLTMTTSHCNSIHGWSARPLYENRNAQTLSPSAEEAKGEAVEHVAKQTGLEAVGRGRILDCLASMQFDYLFFDMQMLGCE